MIPNLRSVYKKLVIRRNEDGKTFTAKIHFLDASTRTMGESYPSVGDAARDSADAHTLIVCVGQGENSNDWRNIISPEQINKGAYD